MKIKKIPFYIAPWFLMIGACLTIGLLSFGGMLALWPSVTLAVGSFVLSVAYEGEIYLQSTKRALKKLFKSTYLERQLAKECLLNDFPDTSLATCPAFFKDYEKQLHLLHRFEDKRLDKDSQARKKHVEKTLADMEKWFAVQLFSDKPAQTTYQKNLQAWFQLKPEKDLAPRDKYTAKRDSHKLLFQFVNAFCLLAGCFTGIGTSYLLVEVFAVIPFLAALPLATLPLIIVPMSVIAGVAYGLLVYNAATDMITDKMILKWYDKIKAYRKEGNAIRMMGLVLVLSLNIILAVCTAGTWYTVAKTTRPLFDWMSKLPSFIMLVMNPLISAVSTFIFNVENVSETLEQLEEATTKPAGSFDAQPEDVPVLIAKSDNENKWQKRNPFRFFIAMTFERLRYLLFAGHIASISAAGDRVPGVHPLISAIPCGANEVLEDLHWFNLIGGSNKHAHKHDTRTLLNERLGRGEGHNHDKDLPTKMLTFLFMPLYVLAAGWDAICSRGNTGDLKPVDFWSALDKEMGLPQEESVGYQPLVNKDCCNEVMGSRDALPAAQQSNLHGNFVPKNKRLLVNAWQTEHALFRIAHHKHSLNEAWFDQDIAQTNVQQLTELETVLCTASKKEGAVEQIIQKHYQKHAASYAKQGFFDSGKKAYSAMFLEEELIERICNPSSICAPCVSGG